MEDDLIDYIQWLSTEDERTRHSHRQLNGQIIKKGNTFSNGLRYPCNKGELKEFINCRCTLVPYIPDYDMTAPIGVTQFTEADMIQNPTYHPQTKPLTTNTPQTPTKPATSTNNLTSEEENEYQQLLQKQETGKLTFKEKKKYEELYLKKVGSNLNYKDELKYQELLKLKQQGKPYDEYELEKLTNNRNKTKKQKQEEYKKKKIEKEKYKLKQQEDELKHQKQRELEEKEQEKTKIKAKEKLREYKKLIQLRENNPTKYKQKIKEIRDKATEDFIIILENYEKTHPEFKNQYEIIIHNNRKIIRFKLSYDKHGYNLIPSEITDTYIELFKYYVSLLPEEQKEAIYAYSCDDYNDMNEYYRNPNFNEVYKRNGNEWLDDIKNKCELVEKSAIIFTNMPRIIQYRGDSLKYATTSEVGTIGTFDSFTSSSIDPKVAYQQFSHGMIYEILPNDECSEIPVVGDLAEYSSELELLLKPNQKYNLIEDDETYNPTRGLNDTYHKIELIPDTIK